MEFQDNGDIIMTGVNTSGVDPSWQFRPNFTFSDPCNSQQVDQYLAMTLGKHDFLVRSPVTRMLNKRHSCC